MELQEIMVKHREYINLPELKSLNDYDVVRNSIVTIFSEVSNISGVVEYGTVTAPGVSDLDLMLLVNDHSKIPTNIINKVRLLPEINELIGAGTILTLPTGLFKNIRSVDNFGKFQFLLGDVIHTPEQTNKKKKLISSVALFDWLPERLMRVHKLYTSSKVNVIDALCLLHSLNYSFDNLYFVAEFKHPALAEYRHNLDELRKNWYNIKDNTSLFEYTILQGMKILHHAVKFYANFSTIHIYDSTYKDYQFIDDVEIKFHHNLSMCFSYIGINLDLEHFIKCPQLPIAYVDHYLAMTSFDLPLSRFIKEKVFGSLKIEQRSPVISNEYFRTLSDKIYWLNNNYIFLQNNKTKFGMVRYGNFVNV